MAGIIFSVGSLILQFIPYLLPPPGSEGSGLGDPDYESGSNYENPLGSVDRSIKDSYNQEVGGDEVSIEKSITFHISGELISFNY